jgi:Glycosyl hydrolase family 79 C-terminal beta domain
MRSSVGVLAVVTGLVLGLGPSAGARGPAIGARGPAVRARGVVALRPLVTIPELRVGGPQPTQAVAPGFIGLSIEFSALPAYAGSDPNAVDPVFEQLIRNLAPGQRPVLRIGGDSTDRSWVAVPGMPRPPGIRYTVGTSWLQTAGALARALDARMTVGINLEVDSPRIAGVEARAMLDAIGRPSLAALELGNEPELYGTFPWYRKDGHGVKGRPPGWDVASYIGDFARIARSLPASIPLAAPATGSPSWWDQLGRMAVDEPRIRVATVHRYPLDRCFTAPGSPQYPTIPNLLTNASSAGLADSVAGVTRTAHAHGLSLRVDEFNSVSCSGKRGVSDTFASALWALDAAFAMARVGVDGVNVHTFPGGIYQPFRLRQVGGLWRAGVRPEYYGLMMFAQAAPAGARLLAVSGSAGAQVTPWATRAPDGTIHVVLINDSLHRPQTVAVRIPGPSSLAALERLRAPSVSSTDGVTLGGQSFGAQTSTGRLTGRAGNGVVALSAGVYTVPVPAASAAMLTLARSGD